MSVLLLFHFFDQTSNQLRQSGKLTRFGTRIITKTTHEADFLFDQQKRCNFNLMDLHQCCQSFLSSEFGQFSSLKGRRPNLQEFKDFEKNLKLVGERLFKRCGSKKSYCVQNIIELTDINIRTEA